MYKEELMEGLKKAWEREREGRGIETGTEERKEVVKADIRSRRGLVEKLESKQEGKGIFFNFFFLLFHTHPLTHAAGKVEETTWHGTIVRSRD